MAALLLDTHAFLWWVTNDKALPRARRMIEDDDKLLGFASSAPIYDMASNHPITLK